MTGIDLKFPLVTFLALAGVLGAASAAEARGPGGPRPSFEQIDANGDGSLTPNELRGYAETHGRARLEAADTDGDGAISRAEATAAAQGRVPDRVDRVFDRLDADGDGRITEAERDAARETRRDGRQGRRAERMFERADTDGDGSLSRAEWDAVPRRR